MEEIRALIRLLAQMGFTFTHFNQDVAISRGGTLCGNLYISEPITKLFRNWRI